MTELFQTVPNGEARWAIVDSTGKILETFRLKGTALDFLKKYKYRYYVGVKVVKL